MIVRSFVMKSHVSFSTVASPMRRLAEPRGRHRPTTQTSPAGQTLPWYTPLAKEAPARTKMLLSVLLLASVDGGRGHDSRALAEATVDIVTAQFTLDEQIFADGGTGMP